MVGDVLTADHATAEFPARHPQPGPVQSARRQFLKRVGLGVGTVLVAGDVVMAYRAYDQGVMAEGRGPAFEPWQSWRDGTGVERLVGASILAASAHNTQPWLFDLSVDRIDLHADFSRRTGANDPADRELIVSLGCALENLLLAAAANGHEYEVDRPALADDTLVASVALAPPGASPEDIALHDAIPNRRSNRSVYRSDAVPPATMRSMDALVDESVAPAHLVWLTGSTERRQFAELLTVAAAAYAADEEQSIASYEWWRGDWDDVQRRRDGLTIDGAGLRPTTRTIGKLLAPLTPSARDRRFNDRRFVERTQLQAESAAAFGVITVDDPTSRADRVAGGRLLQRLHLLATTQDLGFQHMNQVTERIDRDDQLGQDPVLAPPLEDLAGSGVLAAFRIGVPSVAAIPSPRRPVSAVLR